jgi:hypothetical protein
MLYKQILKPIWTYDIQLWGCTKQSNIKIIQRFQKKVLRNTIDVPWYVSNSDPHRDLEIATVDKEIKRHARKHEDRLHQHTNVEALQLLDSSDIVRSTAVESVHKKSSDPDSSIFKTSTPTPTPQFLKLRHRLLHKSSICVNLLKPSGNFT